MKLIESTNKPVWILACLIPLASFLLLFPHYILGHSFFWICLLTLPLSIIRNGSHKFPFFTLCLTIGVFTLILPTTIGTYIFLCSLLMFMGQQMTGGLHSIGLVHLFLASPFFTYVSSLVSFPIRLQLSKVVSVLLHLSGIENNLEGNVIRLGNHSFLIDQACSGMYLLGYGMLFGTLILSMRIRIKTIQWRWLILYYILLLGLIIWGNIVRIYFLVVFKIMEDHWMHHGIGLIIYALQILFPFYFILKVGTKKRDKESTTQMPISTFPTKKYAFLAFILASLYISVLFKKKEEALTKPTIVLEGFKSEVVKTNVTKLYNEQALIYLKSPVTAYSADHNPMICWAGSGYEFQKVEKIQFGKHTLNASELKKSDDTLYTAWWFESISSRTENQWDWRVRTLKNGEKFYLVNLTCATKDELNKQIKNLLNENILL